MLAEPDIRYPNYMNFNLKNYSLTHYKIFVPASFNFLFQLEKQVELQSLLHSKFRKLLLKKFNYYSLQLNFLSQNNFFQKQNLENFQCCRNLELSSLAFFESFQIISNRAALKLFYEINVKTHLPFLNCSCSTECFQKHRFFLT